MNTHNHHHDKRELWGRRLIATMAVNLAIPAMQIWAGIVAGSMALISDALHNLSDFTAILISYIALRMGARGPDSRQTFGYRRVEVLAAVFNVTLLFGVALYISVEAWQRLHHPVPISGKIVTGAGLIAFSANLFTSWLLRAGAKVDINLRSAFLHMATDALASLGVAVLGIVWIFKPWYWLDPVMTWIIVLMILPSGWGILKEAFLIFMNATPAGIDPDSVLHEIAAIEGVREVHHVHLWNLAQEGVSLTAHIVVADQPLSSVDTLAAKIRVSLAERFGIAHPILQFETKSESVVSILEIPPAGNDRSRGH